MKRIDLLADALGNAAGFAEYLDYTHVPGMLACELCTQQEQQGISVYDWPVTAGIAPILFILYMLHVRCEASIAVFVHSRSVGDEVATERYDEALLALYRGRMICRKGYFLSVRQTYGNVMFPLRGSWTRLLVLDVACTAPDLFLDEQALWSDCDVRFV
jgi:hypothetical protein